ncbi:MAG: hypothetical protein JNL01_02505 [Bdellovibrionales bacterium]|nr:hypothetical protein [Bdellovibrionales bacterium]
MNAIALFLGFQSAWASQTPFTPIPCENGKTVDGIEYVLTTYRANGPNRAVNQIGIRRVGDQLKFTARADLDDGFKIPGTDLEKGCALKKNLVFWKCVFEIERVEKVGDRFKIVTAETEFEYEPGTCSLKRKGMPFNALQVTKLLSRRISMLPHPHPTAVPTVFETRMP